MNKNSKILIIDDNQQILESLSLFLGRHYDNIIVAKNPNNIFQLFYEHDPDLVLLDMNFSPGKQTGNEGVFWLNEIKKKYPETVVILITAFGDIDLAVNGIKAGAFDFILKPWENQRLLATIKAGLKYAKAKKGYKELKVKADIFSKEQGGENSFVLGNSKAIQKIADTIKKVAVTDANVLITGKNGTGKEVVANEIHRQSARKNDFFFSYDLTAISESLFESELFGAEKGAFTDAKELKIGKIEATNGGTLFLDEIGNLPLHLQAKILTVIQSKQICRLGSSKAVDVDFRLISATNKSLPNLVEKGMFREDLLFRINTVHIEIPPLRERKEDILPLAESFLRYYAGKYEKAYLKLTQPAINKLEMHKWPGNIRELKHSIEKAVIFAEGEVLNSESFSFYDSYNIDNSEEIFNLNDIEKITIKKVVKKCEGNMTHAAQKLGISRNTLYAKIEKYGL